ncbi:MAG: glycosyltransferase family 4 protein [Candidatus Zixiibacteriota bacterium]
MKEKRVLILAYYFPPLGMGGVQRVTKFAKYLPVFGWKPYVLTVKDVEYLIKDPSLLEDIPSGAEIVRTGSFDPLRLWFLLKKIFGKRNRQGKPARASELRRSRVVSRLFFPDNKVGWIPFALIKGLKVCRREQIDLIFSSSPPPSLHLTGYLLKRFTGKPWVADFRDPWTGYKLEADPTPIHVFLRRKMGRLIVNNADKVITANPAISTNFKNRFADTEKIQLINQGYDEEDFRSTPSLSADIFTIGYMGTFSPDCDPEPIFCAVRELIDRRSISEKEVKIKHVGLWQGMAPDALVEEYGLKEVFEQEDYLPHKKALAEMKSVSVLLLVTSDDVRVFPAKIFEYFAFRKPILGIVPLQSDVGKTIAKMKLGMVVSPQDKNGIAEVLLDYFSRFKNKTLGVSTRDDEMNKFERKYLTSKLACLFDEITGK